MKSKVSNMKTSLVLQTTSIISSLLGVAPCSIKISKSGSTFFCSYSMMGWAYNILMILIYIAIIIYGLPHLKELEYTNISPIVRMLSETLAVLGNTLAIVIIVIYSIFQSAIIQIGNRLHTFDEKYEQLLQRQNSAADLKKIIVLTVVLFIWFGMITTTIIVADAIVLMAYGLSSIFMGWILVQYSVLIDILKDRFKCLNSALIIAKRPKISSREHWFPVNLAQDRSIVNHLIVIKQARHWIYKVSQDVCRFYSFPVLITIFYLSCCCVDNAYFQVMTVIHPAEGAYRYWAPINSTLWVVIAAYPIIVLSASVNAFHEEADKTVDIVYDILDIYEMNKDVETELSTFAVELLHKKVAFNACGFFSLDCTLLHSILGMVVTYLLILLQFKTVDRGTGN